MATIEIAFPSDGLSGKIWKWKVRPDTMVAAGRVLLLYHNNVTSSDAEDVKQPERKLRATKFGRVKQLLVKEGDIVQPGQVVVLLEGCRHPTVMIDLCAECGADLRVEGSNKDGELAGVSQASVPMVHSIPELKVCPELAEKIGKEDEERLLKDRKLALLVDLDQTIVHTTNDNISPTLKDVYHFQLYGPNSPWYHTRLRPNIRHFLSEMSRLYELHICTFGARNYAHTVTSLLDKDGILFSHRILSRDECFDPASKTANLKALFPCGDDLVCIIDDREDVWQGCGNLVQVKPYHFFRHTGDIHAPPGLEKGDVSCPIDSKDLDEQCPIDSKDLDEQCPIDSKDLNVQQCQDKDAKNDLIHSLSEVLATDSCSEKIDSYPEEKEISHQKENCDESKETKNEEIKVSNEENADTNVQSNIDENNQVDKDVTEVVPNVETEKDDKQEATKNENNISDEDEDDDDYLLYLEDILRRIHTEFYSALERGNGRKSLRDIIPRVRSQVLKGLCLTFSGLIPTHQKLQQSRAYKVARAFGAEVIQDLSERTTHLVAIRKGTLKANIAKKNENIKIVNPDWLWTCAERWEHVDERLFPLTSQARGSRVPPPHCSSPAHVDEIETESMENSFANTINPLMSFTAEEIEFMDKEVEEDMEEQDADMPTFETEDDHKRIHCRSSDSEDSVNASDWNLRKKKKKRLSNESSDESSSEDRDDNCDSDDNDSSAERFRRGEDLPDDLDLDDNSQDSIDDFEGDNEDDREWNAMGAALEREFLSE